MGSGRFQAFGYRANAPLNFALVETVGRVARSSSSTLLPLFFWVSFSIPSSRKKGTLIMKGLLGNLGRKDSSSG